MATTVQARIDSLANELQSSSPNFSLFNEISVETIKETLNKKSEGRFDWEIFEQLVDRLEEKRNDGEIKTLNWKNFCVVFIEAEEMLKQKISNARKILEDCLLKRGEVDSKLMEARSSEILNQYGIAHNSHVTLTVKTLSITPTRNTSNLQPYVQIKVGSNQSYQTTNGKVTTGQESIEIFVMNYDRASSDSLIGAVTIPLSLLKDQYPRENLYGLQGLDKSEIGTICLSLQWLHSQEKYLSDTLMQWDEHIRGQEESMVQCQQDLAGLYMPFQQYLTLFRTDMANAFSHSNNAPAAKTQQRSNQNDQQIGLHISKSPEYEKIDLRGVALQGVIEIDKSMYRLALGLVAIFAFLTLMSLTYRSQFFDWMVCLATVLFYELHVFDHMRAKLILYALVAAIIFDFFWLFIYSAGWWEGHNENNIEIFDSTLRRFSILMSYLSFFIKFPLTIAMYRLQKELEKQLEGKKVVKEKLQNTLNFNRSPEYAATSLPFSSVQVPGSGQVNRQYIVSNVPAYATGQIQNPVLFGRPIHESVLQPGSIYKP